MSPEPSLDRFDRRDLLVAAALLLGAFAIFFFSPVSQISDSRYSMLLAEHLLLEQRFELDPYFWPRVDSRDYPQVMPGQVLPRHVQPGGLKPKRRGPPRQAPLYYVYPHGTSVLTVPAVAILRVFGVSTIAPDGRYDAKGEAFLQQFCAAFLMAVAGVVFYLTARLLLPWRWSLLVAVIGSFGSNVWSTASRAMWSHTWDVLLLALVLFLLLRAEVGRGALRPVLLATLLSWGFFVRPTAAFYIAPLALYVIVRHFRQAFWLVGTGGAWLLLFLASNRHHFGRWLHPYYTRGNGLDFDNLFLGLASNLVAPSRGLLVYSSVMLFVLYLLIAYRRYLPHRGLLATTGGVFVIHLVSVSCAGHWWSRGYGQRFLTDLVPIFVLWAVLGAAAALAARRDPDLAARPSPRRGRLEATALTVTALASLLIHGAGAISDAGRDWNNVPKQIQHDPMRVFSWQNPQWLCALFPERLPPPAVGQPGGAEGEEEGDGDQ